MYKGFVSATSIHYKRIIFVTIPAPSNSRVLLPVSVLTSNISNEEKIEILSEFLEIKATYL